MKNLFYISFLALGITIISCNKTSTTETEEQKTSPEAEISKIELASDKDPVCQMSVKGSPSDTINYHGKVYGFCNPGCKEEFQKNPEQYLK